MSLFKKSLFVLVAGSVLVGNLALAEGVFQERKRAGHELTAAEQRQLTIEFYEKFGHQKSSPIKKSNNPWQAKKQRSMTQSPAISWGECRDYALQKRNSCYKQGKDAYNCERFYEARTQKCNQDF
ncbi:MAG: hypothetical protein OQL06_08060 [Gammaproteobacteria bacterium]|nr:hypothetical protein [Gammaproteobacteria bacterium]